ncbi:hypothetical protein ABW12_02505 [Pluralibacter gergoviae]|nr:hypothetical protein ABW12_02505 [Pluralibacter gergoviae]
MGKRDENYQIVYRGQQLQRYIPGGRVLFQREKLDGSGVWVGRTCDGVFWLEIDRPLLLLDALSAILEFDRPRQRRRCPRKKVKRCRFSESA